RSQYAAAHRVAWELTHGPIPDGLWVLHRCDQPLCVRPEPGHLYLGTREDNLRDMWMRQRRGEGPAPRLNVFVPAPPRPRRPVEERFWSKVQKTESCWLWTGAINKNAGGYGCFTVERGQPTQRAHRLAWEWANGPIPKGMDLCHNCPGGDNPRCVNPAHLFLGTRSENMRDAATKGQIKSAKQTH